MEENLEIENAKTDDKPIDNEQIENEQKPKSKTILLLKIFGVVLLFFILLLLEIDREEGHIRNLPFFGTMQLEYTDTTNKFGEIHIRGSWDGAVPYPSLVDVTCNMYNKICTVEIADITYDTLSLKNEFYNITRWDNNFIEAEKENETYLFKLIINRNMERLTRSKYPIKDKNLIEANTIEEHQNLIGGFDAYIKTRNYMIKKLRFINNPVIKTTNFIANKTTKKTEKKVK